MEPRKTVQISLIASVASSNLSLPADDEQLRLTRETLASREESLRLTRLTFDAGVRSGLELRGAESLVESARVTLAQLERQRALDLNALNLLVGQPLPDITLTTSLGTASSALSGLFRSGSFGWTFAPQLLLSIFDGGRNQANLDAARVGRDIAVAQNLVAVYKTLGGGWKE